jgi:hypothetical protein
VTGEMSEVKILGSSVRQTQRIFAALAVLLFLNSILRGIRAPSRWAYTHMLFNYSFGFSKRALLGSIISAVNIPYLYRYEFCFWLSAAVLFTSSILLVVMVIRLIQTGALSNALAALLFSSSLAVVFFAHAIGYLEQISLLITLILLNIKSFRMRLALAAILFPISVMIHEVGYLLFFPVLLLSFLIHDAYRRNRGSCLVAIGILFSIVSGVVFLVGRAHLSDEAATAMYHAVQAKANYPLRRDGFIMPTLTSYDSFRMTIALWRDQLFLREVFYSTLVTIPTTLYFLWQSLVSLKRHGYKLEVRFLSVVASLCPLVLHVLGPDVARWSTLATTTSFLVFCVLTLDGTKGYQEHTSIRAEIPLLACLLVIMNVGASIPLFDGYIVQSFPYEEHVEDVVEMLSGKQGLPPPPERCVEDGCITIVDFPCPRSAVSFHAWEANEDVFRRCGISPGSYVQPWDIRAKRFLSLP